MIETLMRKFSGHDIFQKSDKLKRMPREISSGIRKAEKIFKVPTLKIWMQKKNMQKSSPQSTTDSQSDVVEKNADASTESEGSMPIPRFSLKT